MKLYYSPAACSLSPHIVAREAGIPIELVKVDLKAHTLADGTDYTTVNPKGSVPLLELDDGDRLSEGPAIVQYLADRNPAAGLAPAAGTMARYRLQEWLNFITSELHKQYSPLFDTAVPAEYRDAVRSRLAKRFDWLSTRLAQQDYLTGAQFSVADAYLFTVLSWNRWVGLDTARWPVLEAYVARVAARPKVQEALKAEGLAK
jgi:glutathione S-transferase